MGEVLSLDVLEGDAQLGGPRRQQARGALRTRDARVDAVDGDFVAHHLHGQGLGQVHQRGVARPTAEIPGIAGIGSADVQRAR
jgi:hypothetical protein